MLGKFMNISKTAQAVSKYNMAYTSLKICACHFIHDIVLPREVYATLTCTVIRLRPLFIVSWL